MKNNTHTHTIFYKGMYNAILFKNIGLDRLRTVRLKLRSFTCTSSCKFQRKMLFAGKTTLLKVSVIEFALNQAIICTCSDSVLKTACLPPSLDILIGEKGEIDA